MKRIFAVTFLAWLAWVAWIVTQTDSASAQSVTTVDTLAGNNITIPCAVTNNGNLTANVLIGNGARGLVNGAASGAVPVNADGSATTAGQITALGLVVTGITNGFTPAAYLPGGLTSSGVIVTGSFPGTVTLNDASGNLRLVLGTNDNLFMSNAVTSSTISMTNGGVTAVAGTRTFKHDSSGTTITNTATLTGTDFAGGKRTDYYNGLATVVVDKTNGNYTASGNNTSSNGFSVNATHFLKPPTNAPTDAQVITATGAAGDTKWAAASGGVGGSATNALSKVLTNGTDVGAGVTITNLNIIAGANVTVTGSVSSGQANIGISSSASGGLGYLMYASGAVNSFNPSSATTYYIGDGVSLAAGTTASQVQMIAPKTGTLKSVRLSARCNGTVGTSENVTYYVTNLTSVAGSGTGTMTWTTGVRLANTTGLSLAVTTGDALAIAILTPTWSTAPTSVTTTGYLYIE